MRRKEEENATKYEKVAGEELKWRVHKDLWRQRKMMKILLLLLCCCYYYYYYHYYYSISAHVKFM